MNQDITRLDNVAILGVLILAGHRASNNEGLSLLAAKGKWMAGFFTLLSEIRIMQLGVIINRLFQAHFIKWLKY